MPEGGDRHVRAPLSPAEITTTSETLRSAGHLDGKSRVISVDTVEPAKDAIETQRQSSVVVRDRENRTTFEATVNLEAEEVIEWVERENIQPPITAAEFDACTAAVKADPEWRAAVRDRDADPDLAIIDTWSAGHAFVPEDVDRDRRLAHALAFLREDMEEGDEGYAKPITGLHAYVDLDEEAVVSVVDHGPPDESNPFPSESMDYKTGDRDVREDLLTYDVVQPDGPSWDIDGWTVEWQRWRFHVGWTQREGLVLHNVTYDDPGHKGSDPGHRSVLSRASVAEMAVPYGTPVQSDRFKNAMDAGEYNLGRLASSLVEGCDCLGHMHYWDVTINDTDGSPETIENAICLHEEDYGLLWKRTDWRREQSEVRRNRRLVVSFIATVGNYDYAFYWYFYQDGSIQAQVRLTGIDSVHAVAPDADPGGYAELVAPGVAAPIHQHFFCFRLDVDVDGKENSLYEVQNQTVPYGAGGEGSNNPRAPATASRPNPGGNAFYADRRRLDTEQEAKRQINPLAGRYWKVVNPSETNRLGEPVGYKLVPEDNVAPAAQPNSSVLERAGFIQNHLWATPYRPDERFPAGKYPNQHPGGAGLPKWTAADRSLVEEDIVLWYTLGVNHVTRPEDWPVLPVEIANVRLKPVGFFEENPAIDVPPEDRLH
jgi:primary-amine oxidase